MIREWAIPKTGLPLERLSMKSPTTGCARSAERIRLSSRRRNSLDSPAPARFSRASTKAQSGISGCGTRDSHAQRGTSRHPRNKTGPASAMRHKLIRAGSMPDVRALERLYQLGNRREFVHPDPLETLYEYPHDEDREAVGLIAACLAYGRVAQILRSLRFVLSSLGSHPAQFLRSATAAEIKRAAAGFRHRFTDEADLAHFLIAVGQLLRDFGSLEKSFSSCICPGDTTTFPAVRKWAAMLAPRGRSSLVPDADGGSAFKRLHLYLRWMLRKDDVDPGCWNCAPPSMLVMPLDTHMCQIAKSWRLTMRSSMDETMALEITGRFRDVRPDDPVRYDFVLTRFGINPGATVHWV